MIGQKLDNRYLILSLIGEGGMAVVYRAKDLRLGREVAIKILHRHTASKEDIILRFEKEAEITAKFEHPNIVRIFDYGFSNDGRGYIASELVKGKNFHSLQIAQLKDQENNFPEILCAMICIEALKGLYSVHKLGYVHRDLKPDNILICADGTVKLTDFGIAKDLKSNVTKVGHFLGSPGYSSPEQVMCKQIDFRSDLYSMGVILYEAITGKLPFSGNGSQEVMAKILHGSYIHPSKFIPHIYPNLEKIIVTALNTSPEQRFTSTKLMLEELEKFVNELGIINNKKSIAEFFYNQKNFLKKYEKRNELKQTINKTNKTQIIRKVPPALSLKRAQQKTLFAKKPTGKSISVKAQSIKARSTIRNKAPAKVPKSYIKKHTKIYELLPPKGVIHLQNTDEFDLNSPIYKIFVGLVLIILFLILLLNIGSIKKLYISKIKKPIIENIIQIKKDGF